MPIPRLVLVGMMLIHRKALYWRLADGNRPEFGGVSKASKQILSGLLPLRHFISTLLRKLAITCEPLKGSLTPLYYRMNFVIPSIAFTRTYIPSHKLYFYLCVIPSTIRWDLKVRLP